jgi:hypothetical protein
MRLVPRKIEPRIAFYKNRVGRWSEVAEQIGTTPQMVAELAELADAAQAALRAQLAAQQTARTATQRLKHAAKLLSKKGAAILQQVRAQASSEGNIEPYLLARVDTPSKRTRIKPPGKPDDFSFKWNSMGWLELRWACKNPRGAVGTVYQVRRKLGHDGKFEVLGMAGEKKFLDMTIPPGTGVVQYEVRAMRSTEVGPPGRFEVPLGSVATGLGTMHEPRRRAVLRAA